MFPSDHNMIFSNHYYPKIPIYTPLVAPQGPPNSVYLRVLLTTLLLFSLRIKDILLVVEGTLRWLNLLTILTLLTLLMTPRTVESVESVVESVELVEPANLVESAIEPVVSTLLKTLLTLIERVYC